MREITSHKVNGLNDALKIQVLDEPGPGGACQRYHITTVEPAKCEAMIRAVTDIRFQSGNPAEGINGISNEVLLAIVEDRLKGFQAGPYSCRENALALTHLQEAVHWLNHRTRERDQRGVEGTLQK